MGLQSAVISAGATLSSTGGTDTTLTPDGQTVPNGLHLIDASVTDFRIRPGLTAKYRAPTLDGSGLYSKDKKTLVYVEPVILASGKTTFCVVRIEREIHPEVSAAVALDILLKGSQMCFRADFTNFWTSGSLA